MKRYFIDGIEVTQEEAQKQEAINNAILNIKDDNVSTYRVQNLEMIEQ